MYVLKLRILSYKHWPCVNLINRATTGWAQFLLCTWLIVSIILSVTYPKPPLGQIMIRIAIYDAYSPKAVETFLYGKCYVYCFPHCVKISFLLVLSKCWTSKWKLNTGIASATEYVDIVALTFALWQIRSAYFAVSQWDLESGNLWCQKLLKHSCTEKLIFMNIPF